MRRGNFIPLVLAAITLASVAHAQTAESPVEITAQDGLEWRQKEQALIAEGSVVLTRGATKLEAEKISAYYRDAKGGDQEVYRVDATGNVRIASDGTKGFGSAAAYDLDQGVFVLSGRPRLEATQLIVTAAQNLEYWEKRNLAVARGGAVAQNGDRKIVADIISAYVEESGKSKTELSRVEAIGGVVISTPQDSAKGKEAVYDAKTGIATLCGNVEIRRGTNVLKGKCAEVNLNTGVSKLLGGGGGIQGVLPKGN